MSEDAVVRQTRSQKRALERDSLPAAPPPSHSHSPTPLGHESEGKRPRLEVVGEGLGREERTTRAHGPEGVTRSAVLLGGGGTAEVKATIKVEVQTGGEPVDMSTNNMSEIKKEKHLPSPDDDDDDVIVLSDNESPSPKINGHFKQFDTELLMESSPEERERVIKQLKEELRLEEAKLVLLKRLRQSQLTKAVAGGSVATPPPLVRGSLTAVKGSQQGLSGRNTGTVIPPPLVRGGQQVSKHGVHNSHTIMPPLVRGAPPISVSPQQLQSLRHQQHQHHQHQQQHHHHQHHHHQHSSSGSGSGSGPPPLLMAPRSSGTTGVVQGHKLLQTGNLVRMANLPTNSLLVSIPQSSPTNLKSLSSGVGSQQGVAGGNQGGVADSPASRQAAAKLALRKQLEKTLLEIPPPQPPSPEFYFLPSAANNEFIYLIGLEEVVQTLLDLGRAKLGLPLASTSATSSREPFTCSQCQTDFTCRWRQDKGGATLCEQCMSSNQKKALKAEHTARLKAAFVKALQQEQEMEQCLLQQTTAAQTTSSSSSSSSSLSAASSAMHMVKAEHLTKQRSSLQHHHLSQSNPNVARHQASIKQAQNAGQLSRGGSQVQASALGLGVSLGVRGVPHSFSSSSQLQSAVAAAALVARPGKSAHNQGRVHAALGSHGNTAVWRKPSSSSSGVTMAYVNPSLSVHKTSSSPSSSSSSSSSAVERQREYLLDMLPSRSLSQTTANTWK